MNNNNTALYEGLTDEEIRLITGWPEGGGYHLLFRKLLTERMELKNRLQQFDGESRELWKIVDRINPENDQLKAKVKELEARQTTHNPSRTEIAVRLMAALISNPNLLSNPSVDEYVVAKSSVEHTDTLLEELSKPKN
jgi:hypothetical protein